MKKIPLFISLGGMLLTIDAYSAAYNARDFRSEITTGLDIIGARANADVIEDDAPGELGAEVYLTENAVNDTDIRLFIPSSKYIRAGGGLSLPFASSRAKFGDDKHDVDNGYTTQIGLGWNLSSFVRAELDFQTINLKFTDIEKRAATYQMGGGMLYFDLARRYVITGDVTRRRIFVPFIGVGAGVGHYKFDGAGGADGVVIAAPRATVGLNVMLTDLIGLDIAYQYQMMIDRGFGWNVSGHGTAGISNVIASFRVNF